MPLQNLKALWLNGNPVVQACSNFLSLSEVMPKLEIINSVLTPNAGEWAMLYFARDQNVQKLEDIKFLDLSGRGVMYL